MKKAVSLWRWADYVESPACPLPSWSLPVIAHGQKRAIAFSKTIVPAGRPIGNDIGGDNDGQVRTAEMEAEAQLAERFCPRCRLVSLPK